MIARPKVISLAVFFYLLSLFFVYIKVALTTDATNSQSLTIHFFSFVFLSIISVPVFFLWKGEGRFRTVFSAFIVISLALHSPTYYQQLITLSFFEIIVATAPLIFVIAFVILLNMPVSERWYAELETLNDQGEMTSVNESERGKDIKKNACVVCNDMVEDGARVIPSNRFKSVLIILMHTLLAVITFGVWLGVMSALDTSNRCAGCNRKLQKDQN